MYEYENTDRIKLKNLEKTLSQCHFVHTNLTRFDPDTISGLRV
jgi:hypothetical protein